MMNILRLMLISFITKHPNDLYIIKLTINKSIVPKLFLLLGIFLIYLEHAV